MGVAPETGTTTAVPGEATPSLLPPQENGAETIFMPGPRAAVRVLYRQAGRCPDTWQARGAGGVAGHRPARPASPSARGASFPAALPGRVSRWAGSCPARELHGACLLSPGHVPLLDTANPPQNPQSQAARTQAVLTTYSPMKRRERKGSISVWRMSRVCCNFSRQCLYQNAVTGPDAWDPLGR